MLKQFSQITAKVDFKMKFDGPGRACNVKAGDAFLVTSPIHMQDKGIKVARKRNARLNEGYMLSSEQVNQLFTLE